MAKMGFNAISHLRTLEDYLKTYAVWEAGVYGHRGGRGEKREDVVRRWLEDIFPTPVGVTKGEVVTADGERSAEFDIVLSTRSPAVWTFGIGPRRVHPAEEVLGVIEVKTTLDGLGLTKFSASIEEVATFSRYYVPLAVLERLREKKIESISPEQELSVRCGDHHQSIGCVGAGLIAFDGPDTDTAASWFDSGRVAHGVC